MSKMKSVAVVDLFRMQDQLDHMLIAGDINLIEYVNAWHKLLQAAGMAGDGYFWSVAYLREIDRRWAPADLTMN